MKQRSERVLIPVLQVCCPHLYDDVLNNVPALFGNLYIAACSGSSYSLFFAW